MGAPSLVTPPPAAARTRLGGTRLVGVLAAALVAMVAVILAIDGWTEPGLRLVVRATARTSLVLFLAAFLAAPLVRRWPGAFTRWLVANRRQVGLGFAISHLLHFLGLIALGRSFPHVFADVPAATFVVGGLGFVFVALMALTSSDAAVARLGPRRWSALHRTGLYYVWAVFTVTYASHAVVPTALLVAALVVRLRGR
jgi:sulfoxide reductase heme-binding subunit YedZ